MSRARLAFSVGLAAAAAAAAACGPSAETTPGIVTDIIARSGGEVGRVVAVTNPALVDLSDRRVAMQDLRGMGFRDADPAPCATVLPAGAPRPAAFEIDDVEAGTVTRVLVCLGEVEGGLQARAVIAAKGPAEAKAGKGGARS